MTARTERPRRELTAWRNAIFAVFFLSGFGLASWIARIPTIRDHAELTTQWIGFVILSGSIASIASLVVAPWLLGRLGPRVAMAPRPSARSGARSCRSCTRSDSSDSSSASSTRCS